MMKLSAVVVSLAALASSCNAFAPSSAKTTTTTLAAASLNDLVGASEELGGKAWDPVGLAQWAPLEQLRKGELSNGRSAMLATVGWFWPSVVGTFNSDDVTTTNPLEAILQADPQWWAQFIIFCGTIEAIKYRAELEGKSYTGDGPAAIDWSGTWVKLDDKQKQDMRLKELKNGRLAMLGIASFVSAELIPGSVPGL